MIAYSCRCGDETGIGSMPPPACDSCRSCGSALVPVRLRDQAGAPEGHCFIGDRCRWCHRSKLELNGGK